MNDLLQAALNYAELGYRVFPCAPGAKTPLTKHGFHDATTDAEQIEAWWRLHPSANVGLATAGLLVVDVDVLIHHTSKGSQSAKSLTDVGAGAGSQSRATDTHLVLRPHEQDDVAVLEAGLSDWKAQRLLRRCESLELVYR